MNKTLPIIAINNTSNYQPIPAITSHQSSCIYSTHLHQKSKIWRKISIAWNFNLNRSPPTDLSILFQ